MKKITPRQAMMQKAVASSKQTKTKSPGGLMGVIIALGENKQPKPKSNAPEGFENEKQIPRKK